MPGPTSTLDKKAALVASGKIRLADGTKLPLFPLRDTTGPDAGLPSIFLAFEGTRVRLAIDDGAPFTLEKVAGARDNGGSATFRVLRDGETFVDDVELERPVLHAPGQAFVNLREKCSLGCTFCSSPTAKEDMLSKYGPEKFAEMIIRAVRHDDAEVVSITSAVGDTPRGTVEEMCDVVERVRSELPDVPVGVEPYVDDLEQVDLLFAAGADEIKLNMTSWDRGIFAKVCPQMDYDFFLELLPHAVDVFGENRVMSNLLYGLGETDESLLAGVEWMAKHGVLAYLRKVRIGPYNEERLTSRLGDLPEVPPERMARLTRAHAEILADHGLHPERMETICFPCGACDVVPGKDVDLPVIN